MAVRIKTRPNSLAAWSDVDFGGSGSGLAVHDVVHTVSTEGAAKLSFKVYRPQHEKPFSYQEQIMFYIEELGYSETNPQFIGHIFEINPGETSYVVNVVCLDPTRRAVEEVPIMSGPWGAGSGSGSGPWLPDPGVASYPRLVFNASVIEMDDDYAYSRENQITVAEMIKILFDDATEYLRYLGAAPSTGTPYEPNDFLSMNFEPQSKVTFESANLKRGLSQLLAWYPKFRIFWAPNTKKWRVLNLADGAHVTLTINDPDAAHPILSGKIMRSVQNRATAVKFFGPERPILDYADTVTSSGGSGPWIGGLTPLDGQIVATCNSLPQTAYRKFQVSNTTKRKLARLLPYEIWIQEGPLTFHRKRVPVIQAWFDDYYVDPMVIWDLSFDTQQGIVYVPNWITLYDMYASGSACPHTLPINVRFTFAYLGDPFVARYPASGFGGTAYTDENIELEMRIYDDMLALGWEKNIPITSSGRIAQFTKLAQALHEGYSDVVHTGMLVLDGIATDYMRLHRRISLAAVDQNGAAIETGWETARMLLTEVEYDYDQNLTTLTFSSDYLSLFQMDEAMLKSMLKIRALSHLKVQHFAMTPFSSKEGLAVQMQFWNEHQFLNEMGEVEDIGTIF